MSTCFVCGGPTRQGRYVAAEPVPLTLDALTEALRSQDLYHHRHGTTPAGQGAAAAILAALARPEPSVGKLTNCPLKGGHEHTFRGPHIFREWDPATYPEGDSE